MQFKACSVLIFNACGVHLPATVLFAKANIMKGGKRNDPGKKAGNHQGICYPRG